MKVGLVIDDWISRPGGVQEYVLGLFDFLKEKGHQPIIFTSGRYSTKQKQGRKIISFAKTLSLPSGIKKGISLSFGQGEKIKRVLKKENPEILHVQGMPGPLGLNFLKNSKSINIMTFHIAHERVLIDDLLAKTLSPLWKEMNKNLHGKIAISRVAANYAEKFCPGPYKIIPIGIYLDRFRRAPKIAKFKNRKINILFVGRLDRRKGVEYLLKAYQRLSEQMPDVRLLVVGDGSEKQKAKNYVKEEELKNVVFAGAVSRQDLPSWYATADIFCSPATHGESFGVVLLEAMASGLPVVAFDNPGYKSIFPKFAWGFLVPNKNISALTQALLILAITPKLRRELGQKNRQYVKQFSWSKVGPEILRFYRDLLQQYSILD